MEHDDSVIVVKQSDLEVALGTYAEAVFDHMYADCGLVLFAPPGNETAFICMNVGQLGSIVVWQFPVALLVQEPSKPVSCGYTALVSMGIAKKIKDPLVYELYVNALAIGLQKSADQQRGKGVAIGLGSLLPFPLVEDMLDVQILRTPGETSFQITVRNVSPSEFSEFLDEKGLKFVVRFCTQFGRLLFPRLELLRSGARVDDAGNPYFFGFLVNHEKAQQLRKEEAQKNEQEKERLRRNPGTPLSLKKWLDDDPRSRPQ